MRHDLGFGLIDALRLKMPNKSLRPMARVVLGGVGVSLDRAVG